MHTSAAIAPVHTPTREHQLPLAPGLVVVVRLHALDRGLRRSGFASGQLHQFRLRPGRFASAAVMIAFVISGRAAASSRWSCGPRGSGRRSYRGRSSPCRRRDADHALLNVAVVASR